MKIEIKLLNEKVFESEEKEFKSESNRNILCSLFYKKIIKKMETYFNSLRFVRKQTIICNLYKTTQQVIL